MLYIDLETRSEEDLIKHGLARYAQHPSTNAICMAWGFDDKEVEFWWSCDPFPKKIIEYFSSGEPITAHNAEFERNLFEWVICNDYDFKPPKLTQWRCSMAIALASGFAGGLDAASQGAGVPYKKHGAGTRLIKEYCAPGYTDIFDDEYAADRELMRDYNILDVEVMRALTYCCRELTPEEWEEYHLNCRINERGIPIDVPFCDAALGYAKEIGDDANEHICRLTNGKMTKHSQSKARDKWLFPKLTSTQLKLLKVYKKGEEKTTLDSDHRHYLMNCDDLDPDARELLEYIDNAGSAVLKKYSVAYHQHIDGRVHNAFLWNGAGRTGRFSGKGLQPHNMRRDVYPQKEAQCLIQKMIKQRKLDTPAETMARLLRAMIKHEDGLYYVDWSAIEGRVGPWLAVSEAGEAKLDLYRDKRDVYVVTAADMFDRAEKDIDKDFRQSGKIAELSLQFGGGKDALIGMAKNYGVTFDDEDAEDIVRKWRRANPWAGDIWNDYQKAINNAVQVPGEAFEVGRVVYQSDGERFLWCRLPSERLLAYPFPKWETYCTPWDEERVGATFQTHFPPTAGEPPLRNHARGALLFQNTVQAVAADLLREALLEADDKNLFVIGSVHDEIIGQGPVEHGHILNEIMLETPWWGNGLPIATSGVQHGVRYGK